MAQTSYWADVLPIGHLWSLALQHRNTTAHRWFPLSRHHWVSIGINRCTSSIMQKGTLCLLICMLIPFPLKRSTSQYAGKGVLLSIVQDDHQHDHFFFLKITVKKCWCWCQAIFKLGKAHELNWFEVFYFNQLTVFCFWFFFFETG